ncbi:MAG: DSD1 family PLP-dependent enzyme [Proteobacteria bacterium]|nr:DSD1 family PLP-dependent enzyme [Pseudomonadota bacterium]
MSKKSKDAGRTGHDGYFARMSAALKEQGLLRPTLVIDEDRLEKNTATMLSHLPPGMACRIVVKSLPSLPLIQHTMKLTGTNHLMLFDLSFLGSVARDVPEADILFGKPMPAALAARFYDEFQGGAFNPESQVQWLIDTPQRLREYAALAETRDLHLKVNIEIDIGLHRGGISKPEDLSALLNEIDANPRLTFSGLMGYDAHVAKMPGILRGHSLKKSRQLYQAMRAVAEQHYPDRKNELTFNTAGSPTYQFHNDLTGGTEVAVGSGLVKPLDFDCDTLADHVPACFIATPVLKVEQKTKIPGIESLTGLTAFFNRKTAKAFFIYGGNWQAQPVSPSGLQTNKLYGRSSNEEMLNGSRKTALEVDDLVFLRPTQSEAVFLQFGDIAVYKEGKITQFWPVFQQDSPKLRPKTAPPAPPDSPPSNPKAQ